MLFKYSSLAFLFAACAPVSVHSALAPSADLSRYRTFAWMPSNNGTQPQTVADQQIKASVNRNLIGRGFAAASTDQSPDFFVTYHVKQRQKTEVYAPDYAYYGYGEWAGAPEVQTYTEGTLIVDFVDPRENKVFWRGTATSILDRPDNPDPKKIDGAVSKLIEQAPPPTGAAAVTFRISHIAQLR